MLRNNKKTQRSPSENSTVLRTGAWSWRARAFWRWRGCVPGFSWSLRVGEERDFHFMDYDTVDGRNPAPPWIVESWNPRNNWINHLSTGEGFLTSTVCYDMVWHVMICYDMLWYVMICYDMLWHSPKFWIVEPPIKTNGVFFCTVQMTRVLLPLLYLIPQLWWPRFQHSSFKLMDRFQQPFLHRSAEKTTWNPQQLYKLILFFLQTLALFVC